MIIAKNQDGNMFELFDVKTIEDIDGNSVQIPQSIGWFSLQSLESQKENLLIKIANIEEQIGAINSLNN